MFLFGMKREVAKDLYLEIIKVLHSNIYDGQKDENGNRKAEGIPSSCDSNALNWYV